MGCCLSRTSDSPYSTVATDGHGDSSSRAINEAPSLSVASNHSTSNTLPIPSPNLSSSRPSRSTSGRGLFNGVPLHQPYNLPVQVQPWKSKRRLWSRAQLAREREDFFDTRVTGRQEVWAALAAATALIREGDLTTAQGIIDAAGITVPTGNMCEGCYDANGALYRLPEVILGDPVNVVETATGEDLISRGHVDTDEDEETNMKLGLDSEDKELEEEIERGRERKGKRNERDTIKVRARLSDRGGPDIIVRIGKEQSVGLLARKIQHEAGLAGKHRIRIAYLGKILKEHDILLLQGWKEKHVVNALVMDPGEAVN